MNGEDIKRRGSYADSWHQLSVFVSDNLPLRDPSNCLRVRFFDFRNKEDFYSDSETAEADVTGFP